MRHQTWTVFSPLPTRQIKPRASPLLTNQPSCLYLHGCPGIPGCDFGSPGLLPFHCIPQVFLLLTLPFPIIHESLSMTERTAGNIIMVIEAVHHHHPSALWAVISTGTGFESLTLPSGWDHSVSCLYRQGILFLCLNMAKIAGDRGNRIMENIYKKCPRMSYLVGDMLLLASADAGKWTAAWRRPLTGAAQVPSSYNKGDEKRLKQILSILSDNAPRYTPSGRGGTLATEYRQDKRLLAGDKNSLSLTVSDQGCGMDDAVKNMYSAASAVRLPL